MKVCDVLLNSRVRVENLYLFRDVWQAGDERLQYSVHSLLVALLALGTENVEEDRAVVFRDGSHLLRNVV